ncbi:MAG: nitroreductase [Lachnospiraceae bacterium]|nr:nitroreductase [Lachnospiraceae bacterium]
MINNETMYKMMYKRKSFHMFRGLGDHAITQEELSEIEKMYKNLTPLFSDIKTEMRIVPASETNAARGAEYCLFLYSEPKDGYLRNIGYLGEQMDLLLTSMDIATLWFGLGKTEEKAYNGLDFVIMIAISKAESGKFRKSIDKTKRKDLEMGWFGDTIPGVSDIARFAPSACNSQPWVVEHVDNRIMVFRTRKPGRNGIMPADLVPFFNRIDMGIYLCFLELCLTHENIECVRTLHEDWGGDVTKIINAEYITK